MVTCRFGDSTAPQQWGVWTERAGGGRGWGEQGLGGLRGSSKGMLTMLFYVCADGYLLQRVDRDESTRVGSRTMETW